jgi:signal transduction histidine kinase
LQIEQHHDRLLGSFLDVALYLSQELDILELLNVIVDRTMQLSGAHYGAAATVSRGAIEQIVDRGEAVDTSSSIPHPRKALLSDIIAQQEVIRRRLPRRTRGATTVENGSMESFVGIPMIDRGTLVGALYLTRPAAMGTFDEEELKPLLAMASMGAVGIAHARLVQGEADRVERGETLSQITSQVRGSLDVNNVLDRTTEELARASQADRCFIRLIDEVSGELGVIAHEWRDENVPPADAGGMPLSTLAARTKQTQQSPDVSSDARLDDPSLPRRSELGRKSGFAVLSTPLMWGGDLLGIISCQCLQQRVWSESDVALIEAAAREVSVALHHAQLYETALRTAERLQELDQLRSNFVSMVSHELRSPMTVVGGIAHILQWRRDKLSEKEIDDLLQSLEREARRLTRLVSEFLDMEAIDTGRITLYKEEVDLVELAVESMVDAGYAHRTDVSSTGIDTTLRVDRDRIKQVLLNLLSNAVKFSGEDQPIQIRIEPRADELVVGVRDRGPGVPPDQVGKLFERFSRLSTTVTRAPGSGIGLYVSRTMVELHGGRMWVESTPGIGATFLFALPRVADDSDGAA